MSDPPPGEGWWQASDAKWYPAESHPSRRPPPPPPATNPYAHSPTTPVARHFAPAVGSGAAETPTTTAAFVCGVIGAVIGLVPILGLIATPLGIIALILGIMGWRRKPVRAKLAIASTILGVVAVVLGVIGVVIVNNLLNEIG